MEGVYKKKWHIFPISQMQQLTETCIVDAKGAIKGEFLIFG